MNGQEIKELKARVAALEAYIKERQTTQLTYPLDNPSRQIVQIGALILTGGFEDAGAPYTNNGFLPVTIDGQRYFIMTTS